MGIEGVGRRNRPDSAPLEPQAGAGLLQQRHGPGMFTHRTPPKWQRRLSLFPCALSPFETGIF